MVKDKDVTVALKKKRKTTSSEIDPEPDVYQSVCQFEEQEAKTRDANEDSEIFDNLLEEIQQKLLQARELKLGKERDSQESVEELNYLLLEMSANVCGIKKLNRISKLNEIKQREILAQEKQKCDSIMLTYENLVYELHHLTKETNNCLSFKSDSEEIELVPIETFMKEAPKEITSKFKVVNTPEQEHLLTLARLEWELTQRKALADECKVLEEKKKKIITEIAEGKDKLDNLLPLLNDVVKTTVPLRQHLAMPQEVTKNDHPLAPLLPDALYILYANIVAYQSVFETTIGIVIIGEEERAAQFNKAQEEAKLLNEDSDPEIPEVVEVKSKRHRKSVQQVDPLQEKKKQLLEAHPLQIQLTFAIDQGPKLYTVFSYYTKLKLITVNSTVQVPEKITGNCAREILSGLNILNELLPNDTGLNSPNLGIEISLRKTGLSSFRSLVPDIGYAYQWAQSVCGLDILMNDKSPDGLHIENVLKMISKRLAARTDLANQMQQLELNVVPQVPQEMALPENAVSALAKWSGSTYQEFCSKEFVQGLVDEGVVGEADLFYSAKITREKANLQVLIVIKNSYPIPAPIYALMVNSNRENHTSFNSNEIRDLERKMNCGWDHGSKSSPWLLAAQLSHLCFYLDVFLEIQYPKANPTHSKFLKSMSGRNQKRPFNSKKIGSGVIFTQY